VPDEAIPLGARLPERGATHVDIASYRALEARAEAAEARAREVARGLRVLAEDSHIAHILRALAERLDANESPG
jgi:hypothetical protein